jgi:ubiquinone/menaquinone biosynthesis C-methylase UbiE
MGGIMPDMSRIYDLLMLPAEQAGLRRLRRRVVAAARGRVLEVGVGTGLNLPLYGPGARVVGIDPNLDALRRARRRAEEAGAPHRLVQAGGERLPFRDGTFDSVVATLVFCSVDDPGRAVQELRRVMAPGGELRLLEHVRAPSAAVAHLQDLLDPAWTRVMAGCHLNRDTLGTVSRAGFRIRSVRPHLGGLVLEIGALT